MNKRRLAFILIPIIWLAVIWGIVGYKEYQLSSGREVVLKTVPVDPRDIFRGEYVALRYDISEFDYYRYSFMARKGYQNYAEVGDTIYLRLNNDGSIYAPNTGMPQFSTVQPSYGEFYINGVVTGNREIPQNLETSANMRMTVKYGIESYFVPEGTGGEIEALARKGDLKIRVVIDKNGNATIKSLE